VITDENLIVNSKIKIMRYFIDRLGLLYRDWILGSTGTGYWDRSVEIDLEFRNI